jgi:N6-adenosine-specific RNA methylase IME4
VAVGVAVASSSFVDSQLVPFDFIVFLVACATVFLVGLLRERPQAVTGLALAVGAAALVTYNNPKGKASDRAARRVRQRRLREQIGVAPPLPEGVFDVIYADPPWASANGDSDWAPENHYPTMALEEIKALEVPAAEDAVLFLCALGCQLPQALEVIAAWGFRYVAELVWVKPSIGLGSWVRYRHEPLLVAVRGRMCAPAPEDRFDSVIEAPRREHSRKPDAVYELIESAYPRSSKLELFARGSPRPGWTIWGNEATP